MLFCETLIPKKDLNMNNRNLLYSSKSVFPANHLIYSYVIDELHPYLMACGEKTVH